MLQTTMKRICISTLGLLLLAGCGGSQQAKVTKAPEAIQTKPINEDKEAHVFGIESGIVELIHGENVTKEILYFDRWGVRRATYTYENAGGEKFVPAKLLINNGPTEYDINLRSKRGVKLTNRLDQAGGNAVSGFRGERMMKEMGCSKLGEEKVGERMCDVWGSKGSRMESRTYLYQGIGIQIQLTIDNETSSTKLIRFEENAKVDTAMFAVPKDIVFK